MTDDREIIAVPGIPDRMGPLEAAALSDLHTGGPLHAADCAAERAMALRQLEQRGHALWNRDARRGYWTITSQGDRVAAGAARDAASDASAADARG